MLNFMKQEYIMWLNVTISSDFRFKYVINLIIAKIAPIIELNNKMKSFCGAADPKINKAVNKKKLNEWATRYKCKNVFLKAWLYS